MACALSTKDNPFSPFTQFDWWYQYDIANEHYCCSVLARQANTTFELSDDDYDSAIERAIDEIVADEFINAENKYCKVIDKAS